MTVRDMRSYVITHPLFQTLTFAAMMLIAGAVGLVFADEYIDQRAQYQVDLHVDNGDHIESRISSISLEIGQYQFRHDIINSDIRDYESEIFVRRNESDRASQVEVRHYKGLIQGLKEDAAKLNPLIADARAQRSRYQKKIEDRKHPVKP